MSYTWLGKLIDKCPCFRKNWPENRTIHICHKPPDDYIPVDKPVKYRNNRVISSRYTAWNFLPKNLFEQFHRIANFYFLCVAIVELSIDSPVSPLTSILPLVFVVVVTAFKQGYEDILRHRADKEVNNRKAYVIRDGGLVTVKAMEIHVGDVVKVNVNEPIPCDMLMLSSEDQEGECYITTANLDGETNLKTFRSIAETKHLQTDDSFESFRGTIECQQPITDLYRFIGRLHVHSNPGQEITRSLGAENVLLRGSKLKTTEFVYGCAIYTGEDTKISLNSKYKNTKYSRVEIRMNKFLLVFLVVLCLYSAIWVGLKHWWYSTSAAQGMWYVEEEPDPSFLVILEEFLAFMILCNYIIPISMYVTIELQKFFGSLFFGWDLAMYDEATDEPAKANTSDINEELGQVEYLFSDKTGTLTENVMVFKQCGVGDAKYAEVEGALCLKPAAEDIPATPLNNIPSDVEDLLTVLALCHTCRVDTKSDSEQGVYSNDGSDYEYTASSPDEKAFIEACCRFGMIYHGVKDGKAELTYKGAFRRYEVLHILDFDSTRKRMSVIMKDEQGKIILMSKGAETAMLERVKDGNTQTADKHVTDFAVEGLRTLVIGNRVFSTEEYRNYNNMLQDAATSMENREEKLADVYDAIEHDYKLLGVTAVEDKLQDGVAETIVALRRAGIQVWVLTGDKEETAINISYSAGHFHKQMEEMKITQQADQNECAATLRRHLQTLEDCHSLGDRKHALIVDGRSLVYILFHDEMKNMLREICHKVITVLCCRMTPLQKALVVRLIKQSKDNPTTAAIGDGANDVSMIQEAHVGLGIMGKEGRQAVRCSDYAFARFKFLQRALLVHGHLFYWRIATLVQYSLYKNVAMITAQLYYTFFSGFTAQTIFESFLLTFYNVTYSFLPVLTYGLLEQYISISSILEKPHLYKNIRRNAKLSYLEFFKYNMLGLWHSVVCFFGVYLALEPNNAPRSNGQMFGVYDHGAIIMTCCVNIVNIALMIEVYHWNGLIIAAFGITYVGFFVLNFLYSGVIWDAFTSEFTLYGALENVYGSGYIWLLILILSFVAVIPNIIIRCLTDTFNPAYKDKKKKVRVSSAQSNGIDKLSISFTKRSGTLSLSHAEIIT